jgi:hypothetical protein
MTKGSTRFRRGCDARLHYPTETHQPSGAQPYVQCTHGFVRGANTRAHIVMPQLGRFPRALCDGDCEGNNGTTASAGWPLYFLLCPWAPSRSRGMKLEGVCAGCVFRPHPWLLAFPRYFRHLGRTILQLPRHGRCTNHAPPH